MKKYTTPIVEKITFDYTIHTATSGCVDQSTNIPVGSNNCGSGTKDEKWINDNTDF